MHRNRDRLFKYLVYVAPSCERLLVQSSYLQLGSIFSFLFLEYFVAQVAEYVFLELAATSLRKVRNDPIVANPKHMGRSFVATQLLRHPVAKFPGVRLTLSHGS